MHSGHPTQKLPGGLFAFIGIPLNDGTWTYTWEKGRQLQQMATPGEIVDFKYNENGLRIQKVATSTGTTNYTLHGKNIVHMTRDKGEEHDTLHFFYDASNKPAIVEYNGVKYAYVHNLQGDIVAILDSDGNKVVEYKYDAWGKPFTPTGSMATSLGKYNPFRYRGYVYDEETGLYYLKSRYYNIGWSRFSNADILITRNMYRYCENTPISTIDYTGCSTCDAISEGGGYISPSARQPDAIFSIQARGDKEWPIPVSYFLAYLDQMNQSGKFVYPETDGICASGYIVDCVGMIRTAYRPFSEDLFAKGPQSVYGIEKASRLYGYKTSEVQGNEANLIPGMAIYWYNTKGKTTQEKWPHIGVYLGEYFDPISRNFYSDAVIQSASGSYMRVVVRSLADIQSGLDNTPAFKGYVLKYGRIKYVDYCN